MKFIFSSGVVIESDFNDENPLTADSIWRNLPIEARVNLWGDEIYFSTPIQTAAENHKAVVEVGDVAYWPPGKAICIFFGPTPISVGGEIRPASPVNVFARVSGNLSNLKKIKNGETIRIEKIG